MIPPEFLTDWLTALGIGLLIGVVRERRHQPDVTKAGTRTHALVAILGYVSWGLGIWPFVAVVLVVGALVVGGYQTTAQSDPGQTGEVALIVTLMLAALTHLAPMLAAGLGVLTAVLLYAKQASQQLSRVFITEQELQDGLMLAAAALVVMPALSDEPVDPWGVLRLATLWRIVVLVMAIGMLGHMARRALGARWGMPLGSFFSGFVSSTAVVVNTGRRVREGHCNALPAAAAALLANLASLVLLVGVVGVASPAFLAVMQTPILFAAAGLLLVVLPGLLNGGMSIVTTETPRAFKLSHAITMAGVITLMSFLAAWLQHRWGDVGVLMVALCVAWVEVHASAASITQMVQSGGMTVDVGRWALLAVLASSAAAKTILAIASGGIRYGLITGLGLLAMVFGAATSIWFN